jgi:hypothetical protein
MPASIINFSDSTSLLPVAGKINGKWQNDGGSSTVNVSVELPDPTVEVVTFSGYRRNPRAYAQQRFWEASATACACRAPTTRGLTITRLQPQQ